MPTGGNRPARARQLPCAVLIAAVLAANAGGCMLTNAVRKIGVRQETLDTPPRQVIVGEDASVAFEVTGRLWDETGGDSHVARTRYLVFDADAVRAAVDVAGRRDLSTPGTVVLEVSRGRFVPRSPGAGDATRDDLPAPLRDGVRIPWASVTATTRPGVAEATLPLDGSAHAVLLSTAGISRRYRPPPAALAAAVLIVPAAVVDVITYPIQRPLGHYWYGKYFGRPAPRGIGTLLIPP